MILFGVYIVFHSVCSAGCVCLQMAADWRWRIWHYKGFVMKQLTVVKNRSIADYPRVNAAAHTQANRRRK
jgi:hypothetical protein